MNAFLWVLVGFALCQLYVFILGVNDCYYAVEWGSFLFYIPAWIIARVIRFFQRKYYAKYYTAVSRMEKADNGEISCQYPPIRIRKKDLSNFYFEEDGKRFYIKLRPDCHPASATPLNYSLNLKHDIQTKYTKR